MSSSERQSITAQVNAIEKRFGTGPTYSLRDQAAILSGELPEWVLRIQRLIPPNEGGAFAARVIADLRKLRAELWPKVRFSEHETTPPVAANLGEEHK